MTAQSTFHCVYAEEPQKLCVWYTSESDSLLAISLNCDYAFSSRDS